jgi:hypothetical protein
MLEKRLPSCKDLVSVLDPRMRFENVGVPYGSRTRFAALNEKRMIIRSEMLSFFACSVSSLCMAGLDRRCDEYLSLKPFATAPGSCLIVPMKMAGALHSVRSEMVYSSMLTNPLLRS